MITTEFVRESLKKEGYILLTDYIRSGDKMKCLCPYGHEWALTWDSWKGGHRCPLCAIKRNGEKQRLKIETVKETFEKRGYTVLSTEVRSKEKIKYICPNGHLGEMLWCNFLKGRGCPLCYKEKAPKKRKWTTENVKKFFLENGCIPLFEEYTNKNQK